MLAQCLLITRLCLAITLLLGSAHLLGWFFHRHRFPRVIGEILGGFLWGPTVFGYFLPVVQRWLFSGSAFQNQFNSFFSWLGLVLLMFISGFEIQNTITGKDKKIIAAIFAGATIIPFLAGWFLPLFYDFSVFIGPKDNLLAFRIVIAVSLALTAIPVLSKIFLDIGIINSRFSKIVLLTAASHDVILWVAVAIAGSLVSINATNFSGIYMIPLATFTCLGVAFYLLPRILRMFINLQSSFLAKSSIFLILLAFMVFAAFLNVNMVLSVFIFGIVFGKVSQGKFDQDKRNICEISQRLFIPVYFAFVGFGLDLVHHFNPVFFIWFLFFTIVFGSIGTFFAARLMNQGINTSLDLAVAMNTKGAVGIILAGVSLDLGIINELFYVTLVLTALCTTFFAGFWFRCKVPKSYDLC